MKFFSIIERLVNMGFIGETLQVAIGAVATLAVHAPQFLEESGDALPTDLLLKANAANAGIIAARGASSQSESDELFLRAFNKEMGYSRPRRIYGVDGAYMGTLEETGRPENSNAVSEGNHIHPSEEWPFVIYYMQDDNYSIVGLSCLEKNILAKQLTRLRATRR